MYKCINNLAPAYLCNLFVPRISNYDFRNAEKKLSLPKPRTYCLKRSFSYNGAILWNNLPEEIRTSNSLAFFKRSYSFPRYSFPQNLLVAVFPVRSRKKRQQETKVNYSFLYLLWSYSVRTCAPCGKTPSA